MPQIKVKPGIPQKMDASDASTFEQWMKQIDNYCWRGVGLSVYDLPDCCFRDWYDKRVRAIRAANRALRRAGACE